MVVVKLVVKLTGTGLVAKQPADEVTGTGLVVKQPADEGGDGVAVFTVSAST